MNQEIDEIKRENKVFSDELQVIESVFEETQVDFKNEDTDNENLKRN